MGGVIVVLGALILGGVTLNDIWDWPNDPEPTTYSVHDERGG